jgi:hypothetical protein
MKKVIILSILILGLNPLTASAVGKKHIDEDAAPISSSSKSFNFTFSPIAMLFGMINGDLQYALNDKWSIGGRAIFWNLTIGDYAFNVTALGAGAVWYSEGTFQQGFYAGPGVAMVSSSVKSGTQSVTVSGATLTASGGYGWYWNSFNLQLGGAIGIPLGSGTVKVKDNNGIEENVNVPVSTGLDFRIGWTF